MAASPLISCVIAVRNGERYLAAAIDSVLDQDHRPLEVLVVDDGSTDGTARIAGSYGPPVRVVAQAGQGPTAARNLGIREARGEFLTFLDADDLYRPGKLTRQLRELQERPEIDLCLCFAENFWEPGLEEERDRYIAAGRLRASHHFSLLLTHRSSFDRVGLLDESIPAGDQADWFLRANDLGLTTEVLPDVFLDRRMHRESLSHNLTDWGDYFAIARSRIAQRRRSTVTPSAADLSPPD